MEGIDDRPRCRWCNVRNPLYVDYHDNEWGVPLHDDARLFEMLVLESFQAGLSWECVLNKREAFRKAFDSFRAAKVAAYDAAKVEALCQDSGIVRNRLKICAAIGNARVFLAIQGEFGSFDAYLWGFTGGRVVHEVGKVTSSLSDKISADLRHRGMKFIGSTMVYSLLQAVGVICSHDAGCYKSQTRAGLSK